MTKLINALFLVLSLTLYHLLAAEVAKGGESPPVIDST